MPDEQPVKAPKTPPVPSGLGTEGRALWRAVVGQYDLRADELALLVECARVCDTIAALTTELATGTVVVTGSRGQPVVSPVVAERRQQQLALGKLLGQLGLPDEFGESTPSPLSRRGTHAAGVRWARRDRARGA